MANGTMPLPGHYAEPTANDRLKNNFNNWFWGSLLAAAVLHFMLLAFFPDMTAQADNTAANQLDAVEIIPEFEIPPPPEQIQRPAVPVLSTDINIDDDITIAEVTFDENPVSDLPPVPQGEGVDISAQPVFTPYEVEPELRNRAEFGRLLQRNYPPNLRDAGIGGTTLLWVFIDESGAVQNTRVQSSSGYDELDTAAQSVMEQAVFSPALNREQRIPVWIALPVTWRVQ
jgi:TonB family protein